MASCRMKSRKRRVSTRRNRLRWKSGVMTYDPGYIDVKNDSVHAEYRIRF